MASLNLAQSLKGSGSVVTDNAVRGRTPSSSVQACIYSLRLASAQTHYPSIELDRDDVQIIEFPTQIPPFLKRLTLEGAVKGLNILGDDQEKKRPQK